MTIKTTCLEIKLYITYPPYAGKGGVAVIRNELYPDRPRPCKCAPLKAISAPVAG